MPGVDVNSAVAGGTADDQKKHGTSRQHFAAFAEKFNRLVAQGAATPERYRELCSTLLKSFEGLRVENERQIADYEAKIAYCRAMQKGCSVFSSVLVGILARQVQETAAAQGAEATPAPPSRPAGDATAPITDVEMLRTICACGCSDEEDAAKCDCSCHKGTPCDNPACVVCQAERALETTGRRAPPDPTESKKRPPKRKRAPRKKKSQKEGGEA